jgi:hypothetical protein
VTGDPPFVPQSAGATSAGVGVAVGVGVEITLTVELALPHAAINRPIATMSTIPRRRRQIHVPPT